MDRGFESPQLHHVRDLRLVMTTVSLREPQSMIMIG
jgi:hypothetical protein